MAADLTTFRVLYPEFSPVDNAVVQVYIDRAVATLNESSWGLCYDQGALSYAAHELALSQNRQASSGETDVGIGVVQTSNQSGSITSATVDGQTVSFAQNQGSSMNDLNSWLSMTPYGQEYLALKARCFANARLAKCQ